MRIIVIGGGITGLTTAVALHKAGFRDISLFEQAAEITTIGAGIWLQPNAVKVLDWLGLKDAIVKEGYEINKMEITNRDLKPFKRINSEVVQDEEGNRTIAIHRGRLQGQLYSVASNITNINLGKEYTGHTVIDGKVLVNFRDGTTEKADIVLAADGIGSRVRAQMFPGSQLRNTGQDCWRGIAKVKLPDDMKNHGKEAWGHKVRFGFSQISEEEVYWFAVSSKKEGHTQDGLKERLLTLFHDFNPLVAKLIEETDALAVHYAVLHDLKSMEKWYDKSICLLGDAAHATTPNMGQGACQGIEDAWYISKLLKEGYHEELFSAFQNVRRKKVDYVVNTSWQLGKMAHNPLSQSLLKMIMKITPERVISKQMNTLYAVNKSPDKSINKA